MIASLKCTEEINDLIRFVEFKIILQVPRLLASARRESKANNFLRSLSKVSFIVKSVR